MTRVPIKDRDEKAFRDKSSGAVVFNNSSIYERRKLQKKNNIRLAKEESLKDERINSLEKEIEGLKEMLLDVINNRNN